MTEPRWHDADPGPPYGSVPGPDFRPSRRARGSGAYRRDPSSARPDAAPESFGQDRGSSWRPRGGPDGGLSRPDPQFCLPDLHLPDPYVPGPHLPGPHLPDLHLPDPYVPGPHVPSPHVPGPYRPGGFAGPGGPGEDPTFYPDETGTRPRRRDQSRREAGRRDAGRRDPEPYDQGRRDPDGRERGLRDRGLPGPDTRGRGLPDPDTHDWGLPGRSQPGRSQPGRSQPGRGLRGPAPWDPGRPDYAGRPDPRSRDWGQAGRGQDEPRHRGPRQSGPGRTRTGRRRQSSPAGSSWRWGEMPGGRGTLIVLAVAVLGTGVTVAMRRDPGYLLGGTVVVGTFVAALAVRPKAVYQLIPVPALAYLVGALAAGLIHQQSADPSRSGLSISVAQWVAGGFVVMAAATAVAMVITVIRGLMNRHAAPPGPLPQPGPLAPSRPASRAAVSPSGPKTDSRRRPRPQPRPAPGPEPPSWPWPEEPVPRSKRTSRREPAPPPEPPSWPRSSSWPEPPSWPRSSSWPEPPSWPGPPSFGAPRDLTATAYRDDARLPAVSGGRWPSCGSCRCARGSGPRSPAAAAAHRTRGADRRG